MQLAPFLLLVSGAAALGINCRGHGICKVNDASLQSIRDQVGVMMAEGARDKVFQSYQPIACARGTRGSICAYYQHGAFGKATDVYKQLHTLLDHGCNQCGSVPTKPGNDVAYGELTINYSPKPCCDGNCYCK
ncbi:hypothetical protein CDD83_6681 [Cordyceps sp. RAO-2017]|nr:hypothetical protein CDD83_6681 [Cordyceps sp. RAO-2017]